MKSILSLNQSVGTYSDFYGVGFKYSHGIVVLGKGDGRRCIRRRRTESRDAVLAAQQRHLISPLGIINSTVALVHKKNEVKRNESRKVQ